MEVGVVLSGQSAIRRANGGVTRTASNTKLLVEVRHVSSPLFHLGQLAEVSQDLSEAELHLLLSPRALTRLGSPRRGDLRQDPLLWPRLHPMDAADRLSARRRRLGWHDT